MYIDLTNIKVNKAEVEKNLSLLTPREERVLRMRLGIGMSCMSLEEVATTFNVEPERVKQVMGKAIKKLVDSNVKVFIEENDTNK